MLKVYVSYEMIDRASIKERNNFISQFKICIADDLNQQFILKR